MIIDKSISIPQNTNNILRTIKEVIKSYLYLKKNNVFEPAYSDSHKVLFEIEKFLNPKAIPLYMCRMDVAMNIFNSEINFNKEIHHIMIEDRGDNFSISRVE
jgi:hypothetical protein